MSNFSFVFFALTLVALELAYFRVARAYKILDLPNNRSLHEMPTIRGGGIIFYLAVLLFFVLTFRPSLLFMLSLTLIAMIGLIDDVRSLSSTFRFIVQSVAFTLIFYDLGMLDINYYSVAIIFIVSVGALNAFNFMDGINGLTGGYGLVTLATLGYINSFHIEFMEKDFIAVLIVALIIFCFFNFRKKAVCFAGDVGSLSMGFIVIYLIIKLIVLTNNYAFVFFLSVYGVDTILTIIHRILLRENIFKPHKLHLFQVIVYRSQVPHVGMSLIYSTVQLLLNIVLISFLNQPATWQFITGACLSLMLGAIYIFIKSKLLRRVQLS